MGMTYKLPTGELKTMYHVGKFIFFINSLKCNVLFVGYCALFKHPNDVLNYCVYIIPGNPKVTSDDLPYWHDKIMKEDPNVSKALGKDFKIERMKAGYTKIHLLKSVNLRSAH